MATAEKSKHLAVGMAQELSMMQVNMKDLEKENKTIKTSADKLSTEILSTKSALRGVTKTLNRTQEEMEESIQQAKEGEQTKERLKRKAQDAKNANERVQSKESYETAERKGKYGTRNEG